MQRTVSHAADGALSHLLALVDQAVDVLEGDDPDRLLSAFGVMLHEGWETKKRLSSKVSNPQIDALYAARGTRCEWRQVVRGGQRRLSADAGAAGTAGGVPGADEWDRGDPGRDGYRGFDDTDGVSKSSLPSEPECGAYTDGAWWSDIRMASSWNARAAQLRHIWQLPHKIEVLGRTLAEQVSQETDRSFSRLAKHGKQVATIQAHIGDIEARLDGISDPACNTGRSGA